MDASLYIWAATKRCGNSGSDVVKCEIDVTSAMNSMNGVIDVILKVVNKCGSLDTENPKVGFAASELTQAVLKLGSSTGKIAKYCTPPPAAVVVPPAPPVAVEAPCDIQRPVGGPCDVQTKRRLSNMPVNTAVCVVDVKGTFKHLIKAIHSLQKIKKACKKEGKKCASNALAVIAAFGGLGEYISGSIGACAQADFGGKFGANGNKDGLADLDLAVTPKCASGISGLVKALAKVSEAAVELSISSEKAEEKADGGRRRRRRKGGNGASPLPGVNASGVQIITVPVEVQVPQPGRLYNAKEHKDSATSPTNTNFVLGAFLPVTALVSFVAGRSYAKRRATDFEPVVETELE
jgi:hypothetical protein